MDSSTHTLLVVFVAVTSVSVLLQACVLVAIFISLRKTAQSVVQGTEDLRATILPMVHSTRQLLERVSPQIVTVTAGLAELTETLQHESRGVKVSVAEIMERVNRQTKRLDGMLTASLNSIEHAGSALESAVAVPVRQANGVMAAIKAVVETYRTTNPRRSVPVRNSSYAKSYDDPIEPEF